MLKSITPYPIKKTQLKNWLTSKKRHEIVGTRRSFNYCPIAEYVKFKHGYQASVGVNINYSGVIYATPSWVQKFISEIDSSRQIDITAQRALNCLAKVSK